MKKELEPVLLQSGLKKTKHRLAVLNILEASPQPITAEQLFSKLTESGISINLSTVYRALESLSEKNLVIKHNILGNSRALFEYNRSGHRHYLICLGCKKFLPLDHCPLEEYEHSVAKETDYTIAGHTLDIYGYCPECSKKDRR